MENSERNHVSQKYGVLTAPLQPERSMYFSVFFRLSSLGVFRFLFFFVFVFLMCTYIIITCDGIPPVRVYGFASP